MRQRFNAATMNDKSLRVVVVSVAIDFGRAVPAINTACVTSWLQTQQNVGTELAIYENSVDIFAIRSDA